MTLRRAVLSVAIASLTVACAAVLGIEDAEIDPALDQEDGSAGGMGGAGGVGGSTDSGGPEVDTRTLCERYCDTVMANCPDDIMVSQYISRTVCLNICATLPEGEPGDESGNTIECRLHNAELAATLGEESFHCSNAGPGGHGVCGENCDAYCTSILPVCPSEFPSGQACRDECQPLTDLENYNFRIQSGNTVQCRLYHVGAATEEPGLHCPHAGGAVPCQ